MSPEHFKGWVNDMEKDIKISLVDLSPEDQASLAQMALDLGYAQIRDCNNVERRYALTKRLGTAIRRLEDKHL